MVYLQELGIDNNFVSFSQSMNCDGFTKMLNVVEVEFVACFDDIIHELWLWNFISRLGLSTILLNC